MVTALNHDYINIINAFRNECKEFLAKFKDQDDDFSEFAKMFISNKFTVTYEKYLGTPYYYDFKEDSLQIAKYLMFSEDFLGGLYLIYALYVLQDDPKHAVRLEYNEFKRILKLIKEDRGTLVATCQPGYVFARLLKYEAFSFPCFSRDFSMEGQQRARLVNSSHPYLSLGDSINKKEWLQKFLQNLDVTDKLRKVDKKYLMVKEKLRRENSELNLNLGLTTKDTLSGLLAPVQKEDNPDKSEEEESDIGSRRRALKMGINKKYRRYKYNEPVAVEEQNKLFKIRKIGRPKGTVKSYIFSMVNDPTFGAIDGKQSASDSEPTDSKLDVPQVDWNFKF